MYIVFIYFSTVPNCFRYHQNACFRDIVFIFSLQFQIVSYTFRAHALKTLFSKWSLQFQIEMKHAHTPTSHTRNQHSTTRLSRRLFGSISLPRGHLCIDEDLLMRIQQHKNKNRTSPSSVLLFHVPKSTGHELSI